MPMLKKIFSQKRKSRQDNVGNRHTTSRITLDPASAAILSKPFMPLDSRAMSPSDLLDSVGHPMIVPNFRHSSPDLSIYSNNSKVTLQEPKKKNKLNSSLKVRNLTESPPPLQSTTTQKDQIPVSEQQQSSNFSKISVTPTKSSQSALLLETSREDKTLVEEEKNNERELNLKKKTALKEIEDEIEAMVLTTRERSSDATTLSSETKKQFDILQQKLMEFEYERDAWQKRLHAYMMREGQMRKVIQENQLQINQLRQQQYYYHYTPEMRASKSDNTSNSRHNSYLTASTRSSAYSDDDYYDDIEDDEEEENQQEREVIVDADDEDDEDDDDGETDGRRRDLISPSYYDRRQYSLPAYYSTPSNNAYPYYPQTWKNYYYDAYYSGGYR